MCLISNNHLPPRSMSMDKKINSDTEENARHALVDKRVRQVQDGDTTVNKIVTRGLSGSIKVRVK